MIKPMRIILFDIDGTLLMTGGAGRIAFEKAFEEVLGIKDAWGKILPDGKTDFQIMKEISVRIHKRHLKKRESEAIQQSYYRHFRREIKQGKGFYLLPGVKKLLRHLDRRKDVLLGLATGNFEVTARLKLKRGGLLQFFQFGGFGSDSADRGRLTRKAISRARTLLGKKISAKPVFVVVGDSVYDIRAGKAAGATKTLAVGTGRTPLCKLKAEKPDKVLKNLSSAKAFLKFLEKAHVA